LDLNSGDGAERYFDQGVRKFYLRIFFRGVRKFYLRIPSIYFSKKMKNVLDSTNQFDKWIDQSSINRQCR